MEKSPELKSFPQETSELRTEVRNTFNYGAVYLETDKGCFETGINNVWLER